jgi:feruloyl esterase
VTERCDAIDGAKDGLMQDPSRCSVKAEELVCKGGATTDCLTPEQETVFRAYITPLRDRFGRVVFPGWAPTNLTGPRGMSYWTTGTTQPDLSQPAHP